MTRVRLNPSGCLICTESGVVLHSDVGTVVLKGEDVTQFAKTILPLLDGSRDRDEVVETISKDLRASASIFLELLERQGLLGIIIDETANHGQARWTGQEQFFRAWIERPSEATRRLRKASILIVGLEPWGIAAASQLAAAGISTLHVLDDGYVAPSDLFCGQIWDAGLLGRPRGQALLETLATAAPWCRITTGSLANHEDGSLPMPRTQWDLVIGTMAPEDWPQHLKVARFAHKAGITYMFGSLQGFESIVGPVVIPGKTACWNCCRLRMLANAEDSWAAHTLQEALSTSRITNRIRMSLGPMAPLLGQVLALEALKILSGYARSQLLGRVLIQNMVTLATSLHTVIPMPWCEICGGASAMNQSEGKPNLLEAHTPEALCRSLAGWVDSRTGVISHLTLRSRDVREPTLPICAQASLSAYTEGTYQPAAFEDCGGKDLTAAKAMLGAAAEAIERYSASRFRLNDLCYSPLQNLVGDVLDARQLCLYEEAQYDRRGFPFVRFDPNRPHLWTRGRWLHDGQPVWVPALPTFYNFPNGADDFFCQVTSNGLAAGIDFEDACLRAVFELVERDAFMLTWLCRRPGHRLMVGDGLDPGIREVLRELHECGAQVELYLLDVGLSIPTVVCIGLGDGVRWPGMTVTSAAHMNARIAARKAILEQGYSGLYIRRLMIRGDPIPEKPEDVRSSNFIDHALFYVPAARAAASNFLRSSVSDAVYLAALEEPSEISVKVCSSRLAAAGVRVAIVDVTAPDVAQSPFRVVRALGIDMQPIHCGFGLDRLANPRLRALLTGEINTDIHPLC